MTKTGIMTCCGVKCSQGSSVPIPVGAFIPRHIRFETNHKPCSKKTSFFQRVTTCGILSKRIQDSKIKWQRCRCRFSSGSQLVFGIGLHNPPRIMARGTRQTGGRVFCPARHNGTVVYLNGGEQDLRDLARLFPTGCASVQKIEEGYYLQLSEWESPPGNTVVPDVARSELRRLNGIASLELGNFRAVKIHGMSKRDPTSGKLLTYVNLAEKLKVGLVVSVRSRLDYQTAQRQSNKSSACVCHNLHNS